MWLYAVPPLSVTPPRRQDGMPFMLGRVSKAPFHYLGAHIIPG